MLLQTIRLAALLSISVSVLSVPYPALAQAAASPSDPPPARAEIEGQFSLDKSPVGLIEPVWLTFRLINHGPTPIRFYDVAERGPQLHQEYTLTAQDAAGREASLPTAKTSLLKTSLLDSNGMEQEITVAPGATFQQRLFLPDWFTLPQPGSYVLTCARTLWVTHINSTGQPVGSTQNLPFVTYTRLRLLPSDAATLGQVIQGLGKRALAEDGSKQDEAILSLSVIPDPRIIPIMATLLTHSALPSKVRTHESKFDAMMGLRQFSSNEAADALLPALMDEVQEIVGAAGYALKKMNRLDRMLPLLRRELSSPSVSMRVKAVHALGASQDAQSFDPLVRALHDRNPAVRYEAAKALGRLGDGRAIPLLKSKLQDRDMTLRLACVKGLVSLKVFVPTQWLIPIVRSYSFTDDEYPSLEAMTVLRVNCGDRAAPAMASCLQFDDPRPRNAYNFFLIYNLEACPDGPKYYSKWINGGNPQTAALANNRKILASIRTWLHTQSKA